MKQTELFKRASLLAGISRMRKALKNPKPAAPVNPVLPPAPLAPSVSGYDVSRPAPSPFGYPG